jgi:metallophosphoesterase superfamily enzyme
VNVIGHQHVGVKVADRALGRVRKMLEVLSVVEHVEKNRLAIVPALNHVHWLPW